MEHKSSIHVNVVQNNSEAHNKREEKLDYVFEDLTHKNESWEQSKISDRLKEIKDLCIEKSGRKLQKNAEPIREAVVNIKSTTTMDDLKRLAVELKKELKIEVFQIHIHRDEGKSRTELNNHAHLVIDWQDKAKGTTLKFNKQGLSQMQNIVSTVLDMERGVTSDKKHLESLQYKNQQEAEKLAILQARTSELERAQEKLVNTIAEDLNRLQAIKSTQNAESEKLQQLQGDRQTLENNAKAYISSNWLGVDKEKTTENISKLLHENERLREINADLKNSLYKMEQHRNELARDNQMLRPASIELKKFKEISAKAILQPKYGKSYTEEYISALRKDRDFDTIYRQSEQNYIQSQNQSKAQDQDQKPKKGLSR